MNFSPPYLSPALASMPILCTPAALAASSSQMLHHFFSAVALVSFLLFTNQADAININILDSIPAGSVTISCSFNGKDLGWQDLTSGRRYNIQFQDDYGKQEVVSCWFRRTARKASEMQAKLWDAEFGGGPAPCQYCQWSLRNDGLYFESSIVKRWP